MNDRKRLEALYAEMIRLRGTTARRKKAASIAIKYETAACVAMLAPCPYCLAPRGSACQPRYAGEGRPLFGHPSRGKAAGKRLERVDDGPFLTAAEAFSEHGAALSEDAKE